MKSDTSALGPTGEDVRRRLVALMEELQPGERLGAERDLAEQLDVSRSTLRQALSSLEESGVVRRVPGRGGGTFIASAKLERDLSRIVGVPMMLRDQGFAAGTRLVSVQARAAGSQAAQALRIRPQDIVVDLVRIRFADAVPICLDQTVLVADFFPGLLERDLSGSIYELIEHDFGVRPAETTERIEAVSASAQEASILDVPVGQPLLAVTRTTTDSLGRVFEYSHDLFRGDRTRMVVQAGVSASLPPGSPVEVLSD